MKRAFSQSVIRIIVTVILCLSISMVSKNVYAKIEWKVLKQIPLADIPHDIALSNDGTTAYILCDNNIHIYMINENMISGSIPIQKKFSQIAVSQDGERLFVTDAESKQISIIQVSMIHEIEVGQSPVIGLSDAPVSVVAFFDYQCPYCARVYPDLEALLKKYPKDVNLIIKHFPLKMHRFAEQASIAALASSKQNKYQELTKIFFDNYKNINEETIRKYAEEAGLDMDAFEKDSKDPSLKDIIRQDTNLGNKVKVRGVPTLFINGRPVKNRSLTALSNMVEEELNALKNNLKD